MSIGNLLGLLPYGRVCIVDLSEEYISLDVVKLQNWDGLLVECDREVLLVWLGGRVCRINFKKRVWVEVKSTGDWCLFMDFIGKIHTARLRPRPGSWVGRSNCVYVAREEMLLDDDMAFHGRSFCKCPRSSLNVWVSPSTIL